MKINKMVEITLFYCDVCGDELSSGYKRVQYKNGEELHFCGNPKACDESEKGQALKNKCEEALKKGE